MIVEFLNYKCFKKNTFTFNGGLNLLSGVSGVGKSTILNGIYDCLYPSNVTGFTGIGSKPYNMKGKYKVLITLTLPESNLVVIRQKYPSKNLQITYNNTEYKNDSAQEIIYSIFGKNFINTNYGMQNTIGKFLTSTPESRKKILEELIFENDEINVEKLKMKLGCINKLNNELLLTKENELSFLKKYNEIKQPIEIENPLNENEEQFINENLNDEKELIQITKEKEKLKTEYNEYKITIIKQNENIEKKKNLENKILKIEEEIECISFDKEELELYINTLETLKIQNKLISLLKELNILRKEYDEALILERNNKLNKKKECEKEISKIEEEIQCIKQTDSNVLENIKEYLKTKDKLQALKSNKSKNIENECKKIHDEINEIDKELSEQKDEEYVKERETKISNIDILKKQNEDKNNKKIELNNKKLKKYNNHYITFLVAIYISSTINREEENNVWENKDLFKYLQDNVVHTVEKKISFIKKVCVDNKILDLLNRYSDNVDFFYCIYLIEDFNKTFISSINDSIKSLVEEENTNNELIKQYEYDIKVIDKKTLQYKSVIKSFINKKEELRKRLQSIDLKILNDKEKINDLTNELDKLKVGNEITLSDYERLLKDNKKYEMFDNKRKVLNEEINEIVKKVSNNIHPELIHMKKKFEAKEKAVEQLKMETREEIECEYTEEELVHEIKVLEKSEVLYNEKNKNKNMLSKELHDIVDINVSLKDYEKLILRCELKHSIILKKLQKNKETFLRIKTYKEYLQELKKYDEYISMSKEIDSSLKICAHKKDKINTFQIKMKTAESLAIDECIEAINNVCNYYLEKFFNDPIYVKIESFKDETKPKIDIKINYNNNDVELPSLSGGEFDRFSLALLLAMNNVFLNGNILLLDESLRSLDTLSSEKIIEILDNDKMINKDKIIILVCHQTVKGHFKNIVEI